ncbi:hypothetical protein H6A68_08690, partial [Bifidobacterium pullorum subsp. saeculare]|uniref:hypothetical protein n=1 Tax=Bifidobacterium pullorum TaxID=78448 RepID=UPI001958B1C9
SANGGITFSKVAVSNAPLLSSYSAEGDWIIGSTSGNTWQSSDLVNFTAHNVGISSDVLALVTLPSIYALVGKANTVRTSTNGIDWTAQT